MFRIEVVQYKVEGRVWDVMVEIRRVIVDSGHLGKGRKVTAEVIDQEHQTTEAMIFDLKIDI